MFLRNKIVYLKYNSNPSKNALILISEHFLLIHILVIYFVSGSSLSSLFGKISYNIEVKQNQI